MERYQTKILEILQKAINKANESNANVAISIVDSGGHLVGFTRTKNSSYLTVDASLKKAKTAGAFGMPTDKIGELVKTNPFMMNAFDSFDSIFYFGGGLPIFEDSTVIGGIGVSGSSPEQDNEIARYFLSEFS